MDIIELKAKAYDLIARLQATQRELDAVNMEIAKKMNEPIVDIKPEQPKDG